MYYFKSLIILLLLIGYATITQAGTGHADIYCEAAMKAKTDLIAIINQGVRNYKADIFIGGADGEHIQADFVMPSIINSQQNFRDHLGRIVINTSIERPFGDITIKTSFGQVLYNKLPLRCERNVPLERI